MGKMKELWAERQEANAMAEPDPYDAEQARILNKLRKWIPQELIRISERLNADRTSPALIRGEVAMLEKVFNLIENIQE